MNTIITENLIKEQDENCIISNFFKKFNVGKALAKADFYKVKGTQPIELFKYLFNLVFTHKNIYRDTTVNPQSGKSKNTIYRFLNSTLYDWSKLLFQVAMSVISFLLPLTSESRENVLIADDTLYSRSRSKKVDMLTRVYDHTTGKYVKGFKLLTLAWSDGNTTIPVRFRHLVSTNKNMIINSLPENMDKRTRSYKLRRSSQSNPIEALRELLNSVDLAAMKVKYILFDSWFAFPSTIMDICKSKVNVICRLKRLHRVYYTYKGKNYNLSRLFEVVPHNRHEDIIASVNVKIHNADKNEKEEMYVKIIFLSTNKNQDWIALLSTDTSLSDEEIIRIYGKRWNIEVMFKTSKSFLHLDSELQSRSFESLYAHTAIVYLRYIMLAYQSRVSQDDRTCGELFFIICDELRDISYLEALALLLACFINSAKEELVLTEEQANRLIDIFMAHIPLCFCLP